MNLSDRIKKAWCVWRGHDWSAPADPTDTTGHWRVCFRCLEALPIWQKEP